MPSEVSCTVSKACCQNALVPSDKTALTQFTLVLKGNMTLESLQLPKHIRTTKWAPQNDVLAAPSIKVFVTHCGVNSISEAAYHGTPVVAVPFLGDQPHNAALVSTGLSCQCTITSAADLLQSCLLIEFKPNTAAGLSSTGPTRGGAAMAAAYQVIGLKDLRTCLIYVSVASGCRKAFEKIKGCIGLTSHS